MKLIVFCLLGMIIACSSQTVSQKLLASEEQPASFLQNEGVKPLILIDKAACEAAGCIISYLGDGICNFGCYNAECNYDNNDCNWGED